MTSLSRFLVIFFVSICLVAGMGALVQNVNAQTLTNGPDSSSKNKPKDTTLTVSAVPTTVDKTGGQFTTISGILTSQNKGVSGKTISLYYNIGKEDKLITTVTTGASGSYSFNWYPAITLPNGVYVIKAAFAGDSNYKASNAATTCRGDLHVVPEYAFGGLLALTACFAALIVYKKRSSL
jgi:hypothetical protein